MLIPSSRHLFLSILHFFDFSVLPSMVAQERAIPIRPEEGGFGMSYELMYRRAGFLWAALFLNKHLREGTVPNDLLLPVVDAVLAVGRAGASDNPACPLMYRWHGTRYWGAANGLAGILQVLLHFPLADEDSKDVKDKLVQWSHGPIGMAIILCKASQVIINQTSLD